MNAVQIRGRFRLFICMLLLAVMFPTSQTTAQTEDSQYFDESGHFVRGAFLEKYLSASDPLKLYGYPLTDEFVAPAGSPVAGLRVQYFQRARFEYHPEDEATGPIQLAPVGRLLYELEDNRDPLLVLSENHPECRYFPETGYQVCYAFLAFFDKFGGLAQFGYPVSNILSINGRLVQYFENTRFEWHPEMPSGQRVTLTNAGQIIFSLYEDPSYLLPPPGDTIANTILDLHVNAFPLLAVMPTDGTQIFYVIVQDQQYRPVPGAQVTLALHDANGNEMLRSLPSTDLNGITRLEISLLDQPLGLTEVLVTANFDSKFQKLVRTSFRVWW